MTRAALVTGGTRGVGRGIAQALLAAGMDVAICGRKPPAQPVEAGGRAALFLPCDVRAADQAAALVEDVARRFGRLDLLVNNAGGSPAAEAATASPRFSDSIIALNLLAPLHLAQAANRIMQAQETGGVIVNIASVSGTRPSPGTAAYGAAKAGLLNLTQSLAMEWGPKVRVNAIVAGLIVTESADLHYGSPEAVQRIGAMLPLGRMAVPEDIAAAVLYLASPGAAYVSGAQLAVHGGGERPSFLALADVGAK
jgi:NAD(P)-dependent dehydrogenase (short-subunit alcohol dehydrogenase family)